MTRGPAGRGGVLSPRAPWHNWASLVRALASQQSAAARSCAESQDTPGRGDTAAAGQALSSLSYDIQDIGHYYLNPNKAEK